MRILLTLAPQSDPYEAVGYVVGRVFGAVLMVSFVIGVIALIIHKSRAK